MSWAKRTLAHAQEREHGQAPFYSAWPRATLYLGHPPVIESDYIDASGVTHRFPAHLNAMGSLITIEQVGVNDNGFIPDSTSYGLVILESCFSGKYFSEGLVRDYMIYGHTNVNPNNFDWSNLIKVIHKFDTIENPATDNIGVFVMSEMEDTPEVDDFVSTHGSRTRSY